MIPRVAYAPDALGRLTSIAQTGTSVSPKSVALSYNGRSQFSAISWYYGSTEDQIVATGTYGYDDTGRLISLEYTQETDLGPAGIDGYSWTFDNASRPTTFTFDEAANHDGENATYSYDNSGQLTGADRASTANDEAFTYDANGNRQTAKDAVTSQSTKTSTTGDANELASDGTYVYEYDAEGNRTERKLPGTLYDDEAVAHDDFTQITVYTWDYRNRLTQVETTGFDYYGDTGYTISRFKYTYDVYDRRIAKSVNNDVVNGAGTVKTQFIYDDGQNIILQLNSSASVTHRFLYGPEVNQILSDEHVGGDTDGQVLWALSDNLGTVRDIVRLMDDNTDTIANHLEYDSFGNVISETRAKLGDMNGDGVVNNFDIDEFEYSVANQGAAYGAPSDWLARGDGNYDEVLNNLDINPFEQIYDGGPTRYAGHSYLIGFAGMQRDDETSNYYVLRRYYDPKNAVFICADPAQDGMNWYAYVGNGPTYATDPKGLETIKTPFEVSWFKTVYLIGDLVVEVNQNNSLTVHIEVKRPAERGREFQNDWNALGRRAEKFGRAPREGGWVWPHLYKLLNGQYGGPDPGKNNIFNDYAPVVIQRYENRRKAGPPLISYQWIQVGGDKTVSHIADSASFHLKHGFCGAVTYNSLSENRLGEGDSPILLRGLRKIGTVPGGFRIGSKVWFIFLDTFDFQPKDTPKEWAGYSIAYFEINPFSWGQQMVTQPGLPAPATGIDWEGEAWKERLTED